MSLQHYAQSKYYWPDGGVQASSPENQAVTRTANNSHRARSSMQKACMLLLLLSMPQVVNSRRHAYLCIALAVQQQLLEPTPHSRHCTLHLG
jgi:hypothetical protein